MLPNDNENGVGLSVPWWWVLYIMGYMGRLRQKVVPFSPSYRNLKLVCERVELPGGASPYEPLLSPPPPPQPRLGNLERTLTTITA